MATQTETLNLIRAFGDNNADLFFSTISAIASNMEGKGHNQAARSIKQAQKLAQEKRGQPQWLSDKMLKFVIASNPENTMAELVQSERVRAKLNRIIAEYKARNKLKEHGLVHSRKLLLKGAPGTGKTITAAILAGELGLPLCIVVTDGLFKRYLGETSAQLHKLFELIEEQPAVYFFDEFDTLGTRRDGGQAQDVGEMRRILNTFLQLMEQHTSDSLVVTATNSARALDKALFRRFDEIIEYGLPNEADVLALLQMYTGTFFDSSLKSAAILNAVINNKASQADIASACIHAVKTAILDGKEKVTDSLFLQALERHD